MLWRSRPGRSGASHNEREKDNRLVVIQTTFDIDHLKADIQVYIPVIFYTLFYHGGVKKKKYIYIAEINL